jgi:hypothetical protein
VKTAKLTMSKSRNLKNLWQKKYRTCLQNYRQRQIGLKRSLDYKSRLKMKWIICLKRYSKIRKINLLKWTKSTRTSKISTVKLCRISWVEWVRNSPICSNSSSWNWSKQTYRRWNKSRLSIKLHLYGRRRLKNRFRNWPKSVKIQKMNSLSNWRLFAVTCKTCSR